MNRNVAWFRFGLAACLLAVGIAGAKAQEIDASKPTNFYPLLDNSLEYNKRESGGNLFGYRAQLIYPPSEAHLFLFEAPLLYNTMTEKFGLGDLRARYFFLPYKNYDKLFGAFGPSSMFLCPREVSKTDLDPADGPSHRV